MTDEGLIQYTRSPFLPTPDQRPVPLSIRGPSRTLERLLGAGRVGRVRERGDGQEGTQTREVRQAGLCRAESGGHLR